MLHTLKIKYDSLSRPFGSDGVCSISLSLLPQQKGRLFVLGKETK